MKRFLFFVPLVILFAGCFQVPEVKEPDPGVEPPVEEISKEFDGLSQAVFDNTMRIRNNSGMGSGSVVNETSDSYEIETNYHVAGKKGSPVVVDIWIGGDLVASLKANVADSWFQDGTAKDVASIRIPKSQLGGPLPVIEMAPAGYEKELKVGDKIFTVGCQSGQTPRARCANLLKISQGLLYYEPESIPGDSGSAVYKWDVAAQKWYMIGRTAWYVEENGKRMGLAMSCDRVRAIRAGEVSDGWNLPEGAKPCVPYVDQSEIALPAMAMRLDVMKQQDPEAEPIEVGIKSWKMSDPMLDHEGVLKRILGRQTDQIETRIRSETGPIREGLGAAVRWVGIAIAASTAFILITGWLYLRAKLP